MRYAHSISNVLQRSQSPQFIEGSSADTYAVYNPSNDTLVGNVNLARATEVDAAVSAARKAYETSEWSTYTGAQRAALMNKFADLLTIPEIADEITKAEVQAMGQPTSIMRNAVVSLCASHWKYYAGWADKIEGQMYDEEGGWWRMVKYEPLGVCAGIGPWNVTIL